MQLIHVDDIIIPPDRARKEFAADALAELRDSIVSQGLFHPLLLRPDARTLVAGERRLRVLRDIYSDQGKSVVFDGASLPSGKAPFVVVGSSDELDLLQSELDENKRRANLSWQEEASFISRIHAILQAQSPRHTFADTRDRLQRNRTVVHQSLAVAGFLSDPDVAKAPSLGEALKVLEKKLEHGHREALARTFGGVASSALHRLIHGDLALVMPQLENESFDCIIADPPYGVNAHEWDNMSAAAHPYSDTVEHSDVLYTIIANEGFRLARPQAHTYLFCDSRRQEKIMSILSTAGWRVWPWPLIYSRGPANGICPWPEHGPRRTFECIIFAIKGDRRTTGVFPDVLAHHYRDDEERGAHKPAALYGDILERSCLPGARVLDPCIGVGSIFDAATDRSISVTGIEIEAATFVRAKERLA